MRAKISLGIHLGHDRSIAVVKNGILIGHLAQERIDRDKHSNSADFPQEAMFKLLKWLRIKPNQIGCIGISYTNIKIEDIIDQLASEIRDILRLSTVPVIGVGHHACHAYSTFFTSNFEKSLVFIADGAGDIIGGQLESETLYYGNNKELVLLEQRLQDFGMTRTNRRNSYNLDYMHEIDKSKPISLGRKYEQITYLINFKHNEAGKTMGLASYASPLFSPIVPNFKGLQFPLTFEDYLDGIEQMRMKLQMPWHRFIQRYRKEIASLGQAIIEKYIIQILNNFNFKNQYENLCLAGGTFLNCLVNHKILSHTKFKRVHIIPSANDDGQSIGAAQFAYQKVFKNIKQSWHSLPYLGIQYTNKEIQNRLEYFDLSYKKIESGKLCDLLAKKISAGKIIGLMRGRSESGPRALGHRSILADPRSKEMRIKLNLIKGREQFRPFAPIVTDEDQFKYFNLLQSSPFMLFATNTRDEYKNNLQAITHIDGTARVQAVSKTKEPFIHNLLLSFEKLTNYPILLNTSFNLAGDPIVESPHDAIATFLSSDIDILVLENFYVEKVKKLE